ncbi:MAG: DoxX family protein [Acidobacteria bacterium]|nr:DoxX family protein [Acidobacteriota bacterium]
MSQTSFTDKIANIYNSYTNILSYLSSPLILSLRLFWGWQFFLTGKGKLMNLDKTTEFFSSLNIPMPELNAMMAGSIECFGGLLLMLGLGSRLISFPLASTMIVAYMTAHIEEVKNIYTNPDAFITADPFLFLLTSIIVLVFGGGFFSLDTVIGKFFSKPTDIEDNKISALNPSKAVV